MVGQNIGKYRVLERVGRGGMGTVYRAIDETLHREVAIKVLNAELNDPEVAKRFRAEAITVARLNHPGIATIFELFQHEGQWLMVMEFVRGETLEHLVERGGAVPPARAAELCMQALAALAHAHGMGVVHRDLKPANVMITESGVIKIMDFGIARVAGTEHLTSAGFMMGTPAYMAPEQVMGQEIDARADLYAMGVVFYRLTTGKLPFKGDTPFAMAQSQVNDPPTPIRLVRSDLPVWAEEVVTRALAKKPDDRFQSAVEFHEGLARCLAGQPMSAPYSSSAPTELMMTPPRAMPTGTLRTPTPDPTDVVTLAQSAAAVPPAAPAATPSVAPPAAATAQKPAAPAAARPASSPSAKSSSKSGLAVAAVVVLALVGGVGYWAHERSVATAPATPAPAADVAPAPTTIPADSTTAAPNAPAAPASVTAPAADSTPPAMSAGAPSATAPSSAPTAPSRSGARGAAAKATIDDSHQEVQNVKLMVVAGKKADDKDALLTFGNGEIAAVTPKDNVALASMPYRAVLRATYTHARDPKWDPTYFSPPKDLDVGSVLRTAKHWLVLQSKDHYMLLRLDDTNWVHALELVEARTSLAVDRSASSDNSK